ncbi:MAG TPA: epoxide hydrolase N-terminal domain-containing protein [Jatrophihabitans sp.]|nr:epoxide hydrolase N-terminal domain-containing protein [Jatrophihabitans sp.]
MRRLDAGRSDGRPVRQFHLHTPQARLDELRARLAAGRSDQPAPTGELAELADYWRAGFDWRAFEARINRFGQFSTEIGGTDIHLLHVRSPEPDARPLLLMQDWPDSFVALLDVLGPLSDPRSFGADPSVAFHLIVPSLPGCGFSGPVPADGWSASWLELADRLGYRRPAGLLLTGPPEPPVRLGDGPLDHLAWLVGSAAVDEPSPDRDLLLACATVSWLSGSADQPGAPDRTALLTGEWTEHDHGGRFAALRDPELFITEVRQLFTGQHVRAGRRGSAAAAVA